MVEKVQYKVNDVVRMKKKLHVVVIHGQYLEWVWTLV